MVKIVFDDHKNATNRVSHPGFDFADLDMAFFERAVIVPAKLHRLMAIGRFDDTIIAVVFAPLGTEAISIISMRVASAKERKVLT